MQYLKSKLCLLLTFSMVVPACLEETAEDVDSVYVEEELGYELEEEGTFEPRSRAALECWKIIGWDSSNKYPTITDTSCNDFGDDFVWTRISWGSNIPTDREIWVMYDYRHGPPMGEHDVLIFEGYVNQRLRIIRDLIPDGQHHYPGLQKFTAVSPGHVLLTVRPEWIEYGHYRCLSPSRSNLSRVSSFTCWGNPSFEYKTYRTPGALLSATDFRSPSRNTYLRGHGEGGDLGQTPTRSQGGFWPIPNGGRLKLASREITPGLEGCIEVEDINHQGHVVRTIDCSQSKGLWKLKIVDSILTNP